MKKILLSFIAFVFVINMIGQNPNFSWAKAVGGTSVELVNSLALDASRNVYTTGRFSGTVDFDPSAATFTYASSGIYDVFISKLDPNGNFVWAKTFGGNLDDGGMAIKVDASGNIYVTGYFIGTADLDPGPGIFTVTASGTTDIFITKLDASGNFVWAKTIGGPSDEQVFSIDVDGTGNVYTTGYFSNNADFDPSASITTFTTIGNSDIFVLKLDASGNFVWAKQLKNLSNVGNGQGNSIKVDATGNIYFAGYFEETVDFDPGAGTFTINSPSSTEDIFVSKLDASGNFVWAKAMGDVSTDIALALTLDAIGNIYTTGIFQGTVDFDPSAGTANNSSAGSTDVFVLKLDPSGSFIFAKTMGGVSYEDATAIVVDASGNIYTAGSFGGLADFDPSAGNALTNSYGGTDVFISKLDASGNFVWVKQLGGPLNETGKSLDLDALGNIYNAGLFSGTSDFDPGSATYTLASAGNVDIFVHKMCQPPKVGAISGFTSICSGSSVIYSVNIVPSATSYNWNLPLGSVGTSTTNTISAMVGSSGIFSVSATDICGAGFQQTLNVSTIPSPTLTVLSSTNLLCAGESATLSASGALTYTWSSNITTTLVTISPTITTTYSVSGTNTLGCTSLFANTQSVSACLSINQNANFYSDIKVYPNPFNHSIFIVMENENQPLQIVNTLGAIVHQTVITKENTEIDLSHLASGLYYIQIGNKTKKIIKEN